MKTLVKRYIDKINDRLANKIGSNQSMADEIAFRVASESLVNRNNKDTIPTDLFFGISDEFWFWLNTEGIRRNNAIRNILPGVPDENTQQIFTGDSGDKTFSDAFSYYKMFKNLYQKHRGDLKSAKVLDFGCGWGRFIRFFIKDVHHTNLWGCDPVTDMIKLCKEQNKWARFELTDSTPPLPFKDNSFDLIYSFSVFSHLSEDFHLHILNEISRILKPGGIYITTTRNRHFIQNCADLRKQDLSTWHPSPAGSSIAFPDTDKTFSMFDKGEFCHHSFNDSKWPYWGETAIPKKYVFDNCSKIFNVLDFIESFGQNVIVVQRPNAVSQNWQSSEGRNAVHEMADGKNEG